MKVSGLYGFGLPPDVIWERLNDPAFLASVIPGCEKFEESAPQNMTLHPLSDWDRFLSSLADR